MRLIFGRNLLILALGLTLSGGGSTSLSSELDLAAAPLKMGGFFMGFE